MRRSQISVVEITLVLVMFASFIVYFGVLKQPVTTDHQIEIDSMADALYASEEFRERIISEELDIRLATENWSNISTILNSTFAEYELVVGNLTDEKKIEDCTGVYYKAYAERIITIKDNDNYDFRKFRIGVCY